MFYFINCRTLKTIAAIVTGSFIVVSAESDLTDITEVSKDSSYDLIDLTDLFVILWFLGLALYPIGSSHIGSGSITVGSSSPSRSPLALPASSPLSPPKISSVLLLSSSLDQLSFDDLSHLFAELDWKDSLSSRIKHLNQIYNVNLLTY